MTHQSNSQANHMDTSQKINHVYGCQGPTLHLNPGFVLLRKGDITKCPDCGADVFDASNTPVGLAYLEFARMDLGKRPS